eukprot:TRINITY_DN13453_c0_g1_i1.p1 TRINITY_DN13453_c0_g1~~TRINITY_DN13453_c0_g1_i1.p1  ORF type:complete len:214 (+),score=44.99 TRINITY_DN13453_c0_g1_i1:28-669(+)
MSEFSMSRLQLLFATSIQEPKISLKEYVDGYEEVFKFLNLLGTVFGWVAIDVQNKIDALRKHMSGPDSQHYDTVETMIQFENEKGMIDWKKSRDDSGSRNLLILHRALQYVVAFLAKLEEIDDEEKCTNISRTAYESTLMKYHPWVVQKAAKFAMTLLPTKKGLVLKVAPAGDPDSVKKANEDLPGAVESMGKAYDEVEKICQKYNLQSLNVS